MTGISTEFLQKKKLQRVLVRVLLEAKMDIGALALTLN